jgi:GxxExxY protein
VTAGAPIPESAEFLARRVIGCAISVHRALGPGFLEGIYRRAMCIELETQGLAYEAEKAITVLYRGWPIPGQRVDLVVGGDLIVELKAVASLEPAHVAKVISYLKTTGLRLGLLINFHALLLKNGIRRVAL